MNDAVYVVGERPPLSQERQDAANMGTSLRNQPGLVQRRVFSDESLLQLPAEPLST
jgi:hypothetical protein